MGRRYENILETIGNTPVVKIGKLAPAHAARHRRALPLHAAVRRRPGRDDRGRGGNLALDAEFPFGAGGLSAGQMTRRIEAGTLKAWLSDGREIALIDLREPGQFGAGHPFLAVPLPYSRFELRLPALVPNRRARVVLLDDGPGDDLGIAERSAERAAELGYQDVHVLEGGARSAPCRRRG